MFNVNILKHFNFSNQRKEDLLRVHASEYRRKFSVLNGTIIGKIDVILN